MTAEITVRTLYNAGAHFGHCPRYWNPKLAPYIYGEHRGIHIIDLDKTVPLLKKALSFIYDIAFNGGNVLFVGTKRAATVAIKEQAIRCDMPYVNHHWLGGTLTNYRTIRVSINKYKDMKEAIEKEEHRALSKKATQKYLRNYLKLKRSCEGLSDLARIPSVLFVIDVGYESIAVKEAVKLGIPVVAIVDTNNSTDGIEHIIPANDDGLEGIKLYTSLVADTIIQAVAERRKQLDSGELTETTTSEAPAEQPPAVDLPPLIPPDPDDDEE